jgi:hypothetical protein
VIRVHSGSRKRFNKGEQQKKPQERESCTIINYFLQAVAKVGPLLGWEISYRNIEIWRPSSSLAREENCEQQEDEWNRRATCKCDRVEDDLEGENECKLIETKGRKAYGK